MNASNKLKSITDATITPVTAYQFIRSCGSRMSAESPENRIALVDEIWQDLKGRGVFCFLKLVLIIHIYIICGLVNVAMFVSSEPPNQ